MERARQPYEHEHLCRKCFDVVICYEPECKIDYATEQWLGGLSICFKCGADEAPTATKRGILPSV